MSVNSIIERGGVVYAVAGEGSFVARKGKVGSVMLICSVEYRDDIEFIDAAEQERRQREYDAVVAEQERIALERAEAALAEGEQGA